MTQRKHRQDADLSLDTNAGPGRAPMAADPSATPAAAELADVPPAPSELPSIEAGSGAAFAEETGDPEGATVSPAAEPVASDDDAEQEDPVQAPLLDGDIEQGIADIFASLHSATASDMRPQPDDGNPDDDGFDAADEAGLDVEAVDITTFRLLGELDRLWHRAA